MRNSFTFGGRSTNEFNVRIERYPVIKSPDRRRRTAQVAGRNGDLHYQEDVFENYIQPYECYFRGDESAAQQAHAIKAWLQHSGAYQKLQDTYDPRHYRMATFSSLSDIENTFNKYGRCVVNFDCDPRSFLVAGDDICTYEADGILLNPTLFNATPLITVYGTGAGTVTVGAVTVQIHQITNQLILDCEMQNAYTQPGDGAPENQNGNIYAPKFPELLPGSNPVSFTGDISKVEIIPRWWEL